MSSSYPYRSMSDQGQSHDPSSPHHYPSRDQFSFSTRPPTHQTINSEDEDEDEDDPFQSASSPPPSPRLPLPPILFRDHTPFQPANRHQIHSPHSSPSQTLDNPLEHRLSSRPPSPLYPPHPPYIDRRDSASSPYHQHQFSDLQFGPSDSRLSNTTWLTDSERTIANESPFLRKSTHSALLDKFADEGETEAMGFVDLATSKAASGTQGDRSPHLKPPAQERRHRVLLAFLVLFLLILAIVIGVVVGLRKTITPGHSGSDSTVTVSGQVAKLWGVGGDKITTENGTTFTYNNTLGGTWVSIPFNDTAKCQDDSPPLNQPWDYSHRRILGVNLGGWLVLEPFITPYQFEPFNSDETISTPPTVVDEWTLSTALGSNLASTLDQHYRTFITEQDFAQIAAAGLNWIRIPVGWWMIETWEGEPMLAGVSFKYFLKAIKWARKYGLRINLDLHAVPGSQNGYNHSGKLGTINFLVGLMGLANAQRSFNYIRTLTQFISQPEYSNVVPMFSVLNEPLVQKIGAPQIRAYYLQVYQLMRSITGFGQGKGPMMVIHDGFNGIGAGHTGWGGFLKGADRLGLDTHTYFAFDKQSNDSMGYNAYKPCTYWAKSFNQTNTDFGFNFAGEYSLAINDCGLWLNNIGFGSRFDGTYPNPTAPDLTNYPPVGSCDSWKDYRAWTPQLKQHLADLAFSSQDAMQNSFFWTWKISPSIHSKTGLKPNPMWDYQLGLQEGWIRPDARQSVGGCAIAAAKDGATAPVQAWSGEFEEWQVGAKGSATSTIDAGELARYGQWPPASMPIKQGEDQVYVNLGNLPQYVPQGAVITLKAEPPQKSEYPASAVIGTGGDGWANDSDKGGWYVPVKGCEYPNPWAAGGLPQPAGPYCAVGSAVPTAATPEATPGPTA